MSSYYQSLEDSISNQQVRDSSSSSFHGFSKSQMYLQKILRIIASYPSQETSRKSSFNAQILDFEDNKAAEGGGGGGGVGIDLNLELLCSSPEIQEEDDQSECLTGYNCSVLDLEEGDCSVFTTEKISSEKECDDLPGEKVSDVMVNLETNGKEQEIVKTLPDFQEQELIKSSENDCFSLLIEAAEKVSDYNNLKIKEEEEKESETILSGGCRDGGRGGLSSRKRNVDKGRRVVDISAPVVRSTRGRSQVLPSRYRDSVLLAPWKRLPPPLQLPPSRLKRTAAAAPIVPKKRGNNNKGLKK